MIAQKINIYPSGFVQVLEERNDNKFLSSRYYWHPSFNSIQFRDDKQMANVNEPNHTIDSN